MYQIIVNNQIVKEYRSKIQVMTYLMMKGYIYEGRGWLFLDKKVEVKKV